jgi:antitoxin (DNA-binding transcriptional repressor) of toxin-antitoxin stability system
MSTSVSIGKAQPNLGDLVEKARQGQIHVITIHDEPCAQLGPVQSPARKLTRQWRERRKNILLNGTGQKRLLLPDLIRASRK